MGTISESVLRGLMQPAFDVRQLQEPLGMLLGGAQAKRQENERVTNLMADAMGAQNPDALRRVVENAGSAAEIPSIIEAANAGSALRKEQSVLEREQALRDRVARDGANLGPAGVALAKIADSLDYDTLKNKFADVVQSFGSNEGLLAMYGIPKSEWSKYLNTPTKDLRAALNDAQERRKATVKNYQDKSGGIVGLATNNFGQVNINGQWVPIEQTGLTIAPNRVQTTDMNKSVNEQLGTSLAKSIDESYGGATAAASSYTNNLEGSALLESLPDSAFGTGAGVKQLGREFLIAIGVDNPETIQTASDLTAFTINRAKSAVSILASGQLGTGQSITDADREFAKQLAAGDINLNKESLKKLLYLERKIAFASIAAHNENLTKRVGKIAPNVIPAYEVKAPVSTFYDQPGNYVKRGLADKEHLRPGEMVYRDIFGVNRYADGTIEPKK